jgi:hypothetical protein
MRLMLNFVTALGGRTVIAEVADAETAWAIANAHMATGGNASLLEEIPRQSLKDHMAKNRRPRRKLKVIARPENVFSIKRKGAR